LSDPKGGVPLVCRGRSTGPLRVKTGKAQNEQMFSALPQISDIIARWDERFSPSAIASTDAVRRGTCTPAGATLPRSVGGLHHAARTPRASTALTPSTTHGGHPRSRRTRGDDNGLLGALQRLDLLEVGDPCSRLVTPSRSAAADARLAGDTNVAWRATAALARALLPTLT
jgi:hypothetical protein